MGDKVTLQTDELMNLMRVQTRLLSLFLSGLNENLDLRQENERLQLVADQAIERIRRLEELASNLPEVERD